MGVRVLCVYEFVGHSPRGAARRAVDAVVITVDSSDEIPWAFEREMQKRSQTHTIYRPGLRPVEWTLTGYRTENDLEVF